MAAHRLAGGPGRRSRRRHHPRHRQRLQGLDRAQIPHASIITRAAQQVGGAFGSAVLAVILADRLTSGRLRAYHATFWCSIAFTLVAVAVALGLPARPAGSRTPPVADRVEADHPAR